VLLEVPTELDLLVLLEFPGEVFSFAFVDDVDPAQPPR